MTVNRGRLLVIGVVSVIVLLLAGASVQQPSGSSGAESRGDLAESSVLATVATVSVPMLRDRVRPAALDGQRGAIWALMPSMAALLAFAVFLGLVGAPRSMPWPIRASASLRSRGPPSR